MSKKDTVIDPEVTDLARLIKADVMHSLNCVKIGTIQSFDVTKKTAEVQILLKRVIPDTASKTGTRTQDYPVLVDVPVFTLQGGGGSIQFPVTKGDNCIVLFSDRNIDAWFQTGAAQAPMDSRSHDLSDGIALVGVNSLTSSMDAYVASQVNLRFGAAVLRIKSSKFFIKNGTTNLQTLIEGLIDVLEALTTTNAVPGAPCALSAASIAALEAQKALFNALLDKV